jgi:hypothetical protein
MAPDGPPSKRLEEFVTVGGDITHAGDIEVSANQMLKMGTFYRTGAHFDRQESDRTEFGGVTLVTDEGLTLGGNGTAPAPLQYFLAGIGF